ncbi:hypothetical protein COCON_G00023660 [Conger conger]|uniref:Uncharacterized protein n=1 Tax=Conger conger TaxID=82655 RepID=A0A9Q1I6G4_CONCO|nr:hypothetical protein COCON_G00023660 [Conger conger]
MFICLNPQATCLSYLHISHHTHCSTDRYLTPQTLQYRQISHTTNTAVQTDISHHKHCSTDRYLTHHTHCSTDRYLTPQTLQYRQISTHHKHCSTDRYLTPQTLQYRQISHTTNTAVQTDISHHTQCSTDRYHRSTDRCLAPRSTDRQHCSTDMSHTTHAVRTQAAQVCA